ncbi:MAG: hypothetical protein RMJ66_04300, partial [Bacteroidia bacterium]|nr:hypothetical protein [Bacteroidia bacterium]MDW8134268.1 hypothetical protein [Bacteroidia bacterium]
IEFHPDSARFYLIDSKDKVVAQMTLPARMKCLPPSLWERIQAPNLGLMFELTAKDRNQYKLRWRMPKRMPRQLAFHLYDQEGRHIWKTPLAEARYWKRQRVLELPPLSPGIYYLRAETTGSYYGIRLCVY